MPKISIITFFLLSTLISFSQINIADLQGNINTENSELNFIQINDTIAFYIARCQAHRVLHDML